jgi:EmrB/QacA subfamily drug resistance transporter
MNSGAKGGKLGFVGVCLLGFIAFLDFSIIATALPLIQAELHMPVEELQWLVNTYALMLCILMATAGRAADVFGHARVLMFAVLLFGVASLAAGFSSSGGVLIFWRALQGVGGATLFPVAAATVTLIKPPEERGRSLGIYNSCCGFGMAIGPILGGALLSVAGWEWVFWVNVPVIALALVLCATSGLLSVKADGEEPKMDWGGSVLMICGLSGLALAAIQGPQWGWLSLKTGAVFLLGCVGTLALVLYEARWAKHPLLDFQLLSAPLFVAGCVTACLGGLTVGVLMFIDPIYLQNILLFTPFELGVAMCVISVVFAVISPISGRLTDRLGFYVPLMLTGGALVVTCGFHLLFSPHYSLALLLAAFIPFGMVWGMANVVGIGACLSAAGPERAGGAAGLGGTFWNLSASAGLGVAVGLFQWGEKLSLNRQLAALPAKLSDAQVELVRLLLNRPQQAARILHEDAAAGHAPNKVIEIFRIAFCDGLHDMAWFVGGAGVVAMMIYALLRRHFTLNEGPSGERS